MLLVTDDDLKCTCRYELIPESGPVKFQLYTDSDHPYVGTCWMDGDLLMIYLPHKVPHFVQNDTLFALKREKP